MRGEPQAVRQNRRQPGADLGNGTFAASRSSCAEGDCRGQSLDQRDRGTNFATLIVERVDHRVCSGPSRFRCPNVDQQA